MVVNIFTFDCICRYSVSVYSCACVKLSKMGYYFNRLAIIAAAVNKLFIAKKYTLLFLKKKKKKNLNTASRRVRSIYPEILFT